MLQNALQYASLGLRVFPIFHVKHGRCSCNKEECTNPGKHPLTKHGFKDASTDEQLINIWWQRWPQANIGIVTGDGLAVLDIDPRNGGDTSLSDLTAIHGDLPQTWSVLTGGAGVHYYFSAPNPMKSSKPAPGIDIKANGGYVLAPKSNHISGMRYEWLSPPVAGQLAPLPTWLHILANRPSSFPATAGARFVRDVRGGSFTVLGRTLKQGERHDSLFRFACSLRAHGEPDGKIFAAVHDANSTRCRPPLPYDEVDRITRCALRYPPGTRRDDRT